MRNTIRWVEPYTKELKFFLFPYLYYTAYIQYK